jgi:hypothetical protein
MNNPSVWDTLAHRWEKSTKILELQKWEQHSFYQTIILTLDDDNIDQNM